MRACNAPEQPMHAIVIRVIKREKAVRFACRFGIYSIIAINRMRGFAIYQIGRADPPRFSARVVSQVFDRDQFLGVGIDL